MTHGDDDGLRCPPAVAPRQVVILPMLRDKAEDVEVIAFCDRLQSALSARTCFGGPIRVLVDKKPTRSAEKRWNWVRRGAPVICEIGSRDASRNVITFMRRDRIRDGDKLASQALAFNEFVEAASSLLIDIQSTLFNEAKARLDKNIRTDINTFEALETHFGPAQEDEEAADDVKGWVRCAWSKPSGSTLENIVDRLKVLKLTIRNAPRDQPKSLRPCIFTGEPGVEEILVARAY